MLIDFDRNSMNVSVQSSDYTKKSLRSDSDPATMEVVTRTNAVKSPTNSPKAPKLVYTVKEVAQMLAISDEEVHAKLVTYKDDMRETVMEKDAKLQRELGE